MLPSRWAPYSLYLILALAAAVRLLGIAFGLPYDGVTYDAVSIEEIQEVHRALKLGAGEYALVFGKGGLYLILFVEYGIYFAISWLFGWVSDGRDFALKVLEDRTVIYLIGRVTVALMGVATCLVIHRVAKRLYDERVALAAALIGALSYYHAVFSAVINVDIGSTLALWTSLLIYLGYERTASIKYLIGAGAMGAVAIAFKLPGAVVIPLILVALATAPRDRPHAISVARESVVFILALLVALTVIAPEWIPRVGWMISKNFAAMFQTAAAAVEGAELDSDIASITILRGEWKARYLQHLVSPYNVVLTSAALIGIAVGTIRKNRWDLIFTGLIVFFIVVMSLSQRTQAERYLLPIMPALWLLGSRGAMFIGSSHRGLHFAVLALVLAIPVFWLVRAGVEKQGLDTRVHAKNWIEANVPAGARILMDGMQYRFSQSPPLNPDEATVSGKVEGATVEGEDLGRGVSKLALSIYEQALAEAKGPKYQLISTVHGLRVEDISYYVENCFDYIVTSSMVAGRYEPGARGRERFPKSTRFYESLATNSSVRLVHEEAAIPWRKSGPTIRIYDVASDCGAG